MLQVSVALAVAAAGIAKVSGLGVMVQAFDELGLGTSLRLCIGTIEILAGLCLLTPRSVAIGTAVLTCLCFGTFGAIVAHSTRAEDRSVLAPAQLATSRIHLAIDHVCDTGSAPLAPVNASRFVRDI
jgi:uncharacterized membrane protein YphA (DoxX/SURF4 family)